MGAVQAACKNKLPLDKQVGRIPNELLKRELGLRPEGEKEVLYPAFTKLPSVLSRSLRCETEKLGVHMGLPPKQVTEIISATDGDRERQIHYLLLEWIKNSGKKATLEALLRALYDEDETTAVEEVAKQMSNPDSQRAMPASKTLNSTAPVDIASGSSSVQFLRRQPQNFPEGDDIHAVLPKCTDLTLVTEMASDSQSEEGPVELPVNMSPDKSQEETSHLKGTLQFADRNIEQHFNETVKPTEESQPVSSGRLSSVQTALFESPPITPALNDVTIEEKQHELVSGDRRMDRMQSEIDDLQQYVKMNIEEMKATNQEQQQNMKKMEESMKEMNLKHHREVTHQSSKNTELEAKNEELESKLRKLNETVLELQKELKEVKRSLQEALAKVVTLEKEKEELHKENLQLQAYNKALTMKAAEIEREKDAILNVKEDLEKRNIELTSKLELQQKSEAIHNMALEQGAQSVKQCLELEVRKKNEEVSNLQRIVESKEQQLEDTNRAHREALAKIAELEEKIKELQKENLQLKEKVLSSQRVDQTQDMTDSAADSGSLPRTIRGNNSEKWTLEKCLGRGGYGEVFLAKRQGSDECYAVKKIVCKDSTKIEKQQKVMGSFLKEKHFLRTYRHERVVGYVDRFTVPCKDSIHFYIVIEYMPQGSLADVLRKGKLDDLKVRKYTRQVLEGLKYLHANDIIHCDVKCSNILLDENGDIKLADFGCVEFLRSSTSSPQGTLWWMAPEMVSVKESKPGTEEQDKTLMEKIKPPTEKSDVWSVGATVMEMSTGKKPFHKYEYPQMIYFLGKRELQLESVTSAPEHSDEVRKFLSMCLVWDPSKRATVKQLLSSPFLSCN